jgi:broad specificity phosphatase PhoE
MQKTEIYIFRHGETDWNKERRFQGHTDIPLNQSGRHQASELALKIKKINPELILTSDLLRAKQTAEIVNDLLQVSVIESPMLRECKLGDPEGLLRDEIVSVYGDDAWQRWLSVRKEDQAFGFPNGETKIEHLERMLNYLEYFLEENKQIRKVALSTHGGSLRRLVHHCGGAPESPVPMPNCALYRIFFDSENKVWSYGEAVV